MPPFGYQFKALILAGPRASRPAHDHEAGLEARGPARYQPAAAALAGFSCSAGSGDSVGDDGTASAVGSAAGSTATCCGDSGSASGLSNVPLASATAFSPSAMPSWMALLISR